MCEPLSVVVKYCLSRASESIFESPVLLLAEFEPYSAATIPDRVLDRRASLEVQDGTTAHSEFGDLVRTLEIDLSGLRGPAVLLEQLATPSWRSKNDRMIFRRNAFRRIRHNVSHPACAEVEETGGRSRRSSCPHTSAWSTPALHPQAWDHMRISSADLLSKNIDNLSTLNRER